MGVVAIDARMMSMYVYLVKQSTENGVTGKHRPTVGPTSMKLMGLLVLEKTFGNQQSAQTGREDAH